MSLIKTYQKVTDTTGWKSPGTIRQSSNYGFSSWKNLQNLQYWDDSTYAICSKGVTTDISSENIYFYDFGFDLPSESELTITNVSIRLKCLNDTIGGGEIVDELIRIRDTDTNDGYNTSNNAVKSDYWNNQNVSEIIYTKNDWLTYDLTRALINDSSFGFVYRCKGTTTNQQVPLIYGVQVKVDYTYVGEVENEIASEYNVKASIVNQELSKVGDSTTLTVNRRSLNGLTGVISNIYISLSDELKFTDNTHNKIIPSENTTITYDKTSTFTIQAVKAGVGTVKISSPSLPDPINLTLLVATTNEYMDKLINIHNSTFSKNHATERGGGWFNGNNSITNNNKFNDNVADIAGNNYYDAKTIITPNMNTSYELDSSTSLSCTVSLYDTTASDTTITTGTVILYEDTKEIESSNVNNQGLAIFTYKPTSIGTKTLTFKYSGDGIIYSKCTLDKVVTVTKKNTTITIDANVIKQNSYFTTTLYDSSKEVVADEMLRITLTNANGASKDYYVRTDANGKGNLMISLSYGTYTVKVSYDGNIDEYEATSTTDTLTVTKQQVNLLADDLYIRYGENQNFKATLLNKDTNVGIEAETISLTGHNRKGQYKTYTRQTSSEGVVTLPITLSKGVYTFDASYNGSDVYESLSITNLIFIYDTGTNPSSLDLDDTTISATIDETITISGILTDKTSGLGLKSREINFVFYDSEDKRATDITYTTTDSDGKFSFTHAALTEDSYKLYACYVGDNVYDGVIGSCVVNVTKVGTTSCIIESSDYYNTLGTSKDFIVRLTDTEGNPLSNRDIYFKLAIYNGYKQYLGTTDTKGYAYLPIGVGPNVFDITTSFLGDSTYAPATAYNILVMKANGKTETYFTGDSDRFYNQKSNDYGYVLHSGTNLLKNTKTFITGTNIAHGWKKTYLEVTNNDGQCQLPVNLYAGLYWLDMNYVGDNTYASANYRDTLFVENPEGTVTTLSGSDITMYDGEEVYYTATLKDTDGNSLSNKLILSEFIRSDHSRFYETNTTDENGKISQRITYKPDKYLVTNYFSEHTKYRSCTNSNIILVNNNSNTVPTKITGADKTITYGDTATFDVTLTNVITGDVIPDKEVVFEVIDANKVSTIFTKYTNTSGIASFDITQYSGDYTVKYSFMGDSYYNQSNNNNKLTVNVETSKETTIKSYDTRLAYNDGKIYTKLFSEGNPLTDATLTLILKHKTFGTIITRTATTNTEGLASYSLTGTDYVGEYTGEITYMGDKTYKPASSTFSLEIYAPIELSYTELTSQDKTSTYGTSTILPVVISCDTPSNLLGQRIQYRFSNRQGDVYEYEKTISKLNDTDYGCQLDLSIVPGGYYDVLITYPIQTTYDTSTTFVNVTIGQASTSILGEDSTMTYASGTSYNVTLKDTTNNKVLVNHYVVFKVDNISYNALTDSNGIATFTPSLSLGDHVVYYKSVEDDNYNSSEGNNTITVTEATTTLSYSNKVSYYGDVLLYTAILVQNKIAIPNATLIFKISKDNNTFTETAVTDSRGQAHILLNLETGTWTVNVSFEGLDGYKACAGADKTITISRKPTSISVANINQAYQIKMNLSDVNKQGLNGKTVIATIKNKGA